MRIVSLEASELLDMDLTGGSDPYCVFYTNPPGLLASDDHAPITAVKTFKKPYTENSTPASKLVRSIGAAGSRYFDKPVSPPKRSGSEASPVDVKDVKPAVGGGGGGSSSSGASKKILPTWNAVDRGSRFTPTRPQPTYHTPQ